MTATVMYIPNRPTRYHLKVYVRRFSFCRYVPCFIVGRLYLQKLKDALRTALEEAADDAEKEADKVLIEQLCPTVTLINDLGRTEVIREMKARDMAAVSILLFRNSIL